MEADGSKGWTNGGARPEHGSEALDFATLLAQARSAKDKTKLAAKWLLREFDTYYVESRRIPAFAQRAFEERDHTTSLALSKRRLSMYSLSIEHLASSLRDVFPRIQENEHLWDQIESQYLPLIEGRYEADLAFAYLNSTRRKINQGEWKSVEYSFLSLSEGVADTSREVYASFPIKAEVLPETMVKILELPKFSATFRDLSGDARRVASRISAILASVRPKAGPFTIEVINAGFYRNRGAYLVGRIVFGRSRIPLILALLNEDRGIYVDAVLSLEADAHNIFSSTLANFHVNNPHYHELSSFLHSIMPKRPLGLHYSTIGFNHVGKVAVMNELKEELIATKRRFPKSDRIRRYSCHWILCTIVSL